VSGRQIVTGTPSTSGTATVTVVATCPVDTEPVSGGFEIDAPLDSNREPPFITRNRPIGNNWSVTATSGAKTRAFTMTAYAICVDI
jgi:hypothetical protein